MGLVLYKRHQRKLLCPFRHVKVRQKDHNLGSRSSPDAESAFLGPFLLQNCEKEMFVVYELVGPWYFCYSSYMRLRRNLFHKHFYFEFTMTCNLLQIDRFYSLYHTLLYLTLSCVGLYFLSYKFQSKREDTFSFLNPSQQLAQSWMHCY